MFTLGSTYYTTASFLIHGSPGARGELEKLGQGARFNT